MLVMPLMTQEERTAFLDEPGILMRIGTVCSDGRPLVTPIWFLHHENAIWFTPREKSEWFANLRRDPRVCLAIDEQNLHYRKVIVDAEAELVFDLGQDDVWRDLYRRITRRYIDEEATEAYIQATLDQPRGLYRARLDQARVRCWRMPVEDEEQGGIWHSRYYRPGTHLGTEV